MENKEIKKPVPLELEDNALDAVSGAGDGFLLNHVFPLDQLMESDSAANNRPPFAPEDCL